MFHVYILASARNGTLYTGMTHDLAKRLWEHESGGGSKFAAKYGVKTLVWCEPHETRQAAFLRERRIKTWNRA